MNPEDVALENCAREPVHIPGRIQTFGALVGFDMRTFEIQYQSTNLDSMLGLSNAEFIGSSLDAAINNRDLMHEIRGALGLPTLDFQRQRIGVHPFGDLSIDTAIFTSNGIGVVEFERAAVLSDRRETPIARVRSMLAGLETRSGVQSLLESAVISLRKLTGYDRVMAYQFLDNGDGEVAAEAKSPSVESFLGLRYPASDIPPQVRDLMLKMPIRTIADIGDPHARLLGIDEQEPLDISLGHLRGISPIHVEYLQNMGVGATMNLSVIVNGELWGLFAFHHERPRLLTADQRSICEIFGQLVSMQVQQCIEKETLSKTRRADSALRAISNDEHDSIDDLVQNFGEDMMSIVEADGLALVTREEVVLLGETPTETTARALVQLSDDSVFHLNSFENSTELAAMELGGSAGAIVLELKKHCYLIFFRGEEVKQVRWAGDQQKRIQYGPNGPRLHPRASFQEYRQSIKGCCDPWKKSDVAAAVSIRFALRELDYATVEDAALELKKQKRHQDLLISELNHRVRNILALVSSIASQTKRSAKSLQQYTESFEQRIAALSKAHSIVGGSGLQWAKLSTLIDTELAAYTNSQTKITLQGPPLTLRSDIAPMMALVIHELATNAAKHGALSETGQELRVAWKVEASGLNLKWKEVLASPLKPKNANGFGLKLIQRAVPHECGGECKVDFGPNGIEVNFWLPSETVRSIELTDDSSTAVELNPSSADVKNMSANDPPAVDIAEGVLTAIVLDDEISLAMEMEETLSDLGFGEIRTYANADSCLKNLTQDDPDIAILDINLGSETSFPVAGELVGLGVPVVFVSGYDESFEVPEKLRDVLRLAKPVSSEELGVAISSLLKGKLS